MIETGALKAEWTKFSSVRVTMVLSLAVVAVSGTFGWLFANAAAREYATATAQERLNFQPLDMSMRGLFIAQLLISALGVLIASSEYGAGTMRLSVAAVGKRHRLLAAKAGLTVLTALPVSVAGVWLMFAAGQTTLAAQGVPSLTFTDPGALRTLLFGPVVFTLLALFGLALGFLLRGTAAAMNVSTAFLLLPVLAGSLPGFLDDFVSAYWPNTAAFKAVSGTSGATVAGGLLLLGGFVAVLLGAAHARFSRSDV